jgi:aminopeptidase
MDDRVREHAEVLVDWSARIEADDDVVVRVAEGAHDLAVAVAEALGERGADVVTVYASDEVNRAYLRAHDGEFAPDPEYERALYENADAVLSLGGGRNTAAIADVPGDRRRAFDRARAGIREARLATDWVSTVHPTRSLAQGAGMSYEAYREFVYGAVLRDWESLAEEMARLKGVFDAGEEVRLVVDRSPRNDEAKTDLTMSIGGRTAVNSAASVAYDSHNLPSGEVFTAPADAEGEVCFDVPMTLRGRRVRDVHLTFEDGAVVDFSAGENGDVIEEILETDDGARRLGELGVGTNRGIDRVTDNVLFDEKMGGTVHLALGRAYEACLPEGESGNESAVHVDLLADVTGESRMEVDGEVVQRNGNFRWEEGFEG